MKILNTDNFVSERMKIRPITNAELDKIRQKMFDDKYVLTDVTLKTDNGYVLYRIKALKDIPSIEVKKGDLGGWIESYDNLDQKGDCWVADNAKVYGNAKVYDNARVYNTADVFGNAEVYDNAIISSNAQVHDNAKVYDDAWVYDDAKVYGDAEICGNAQVDYDVNKGKIDK